MVHQNVYRPWLAMVWVWPIARARAGRLCPSGPQTGTHQSITLGRGDPPLGGGEAGLVYSILEPSQLKDGWLGLDTPIRASQIFCSDM